MYIITIALIAGSSAYIKTNHTASMAINGVEAIAVVFLILEEIKNKSFNAYSYAMIAFYVSLGISTYLGSSEYKSYIVYFVQALTATLFVEVALKRKKIEAVVVIRNVLFFFLLINLITLILFSQGLGVYGYNESSDNYYYFLGLRIAFTPFILTELLLSHIVDYLQEK